MDDEMKVTAYGAFLFGALYLIGVFVAALVSGNSSAVNAAILSAGLSYVSQVVTAFRIAGFATGAVSTGMWLLAAASSAIAGLLLIAG